MSAEPCKHLESLLPSVHGGQETIAFHWLQEKQDESEPVFAPSFSEQEFIDLLEDKGLPEETLDVLVAVFVYNTPISAVARQLKQPRVNIERHISAAKEILRPHFAEFFPEFTR